MEGAEDGRHTADAERERRDGDDGERRLSNDLPPSETDVTPECSYPGAGATPSNVFLCLFHSAHRGDGSPASFCDGRAFADEIGRRHIDERVEFVTQIALCLSAAEHPPESCGDAMPNAHAPSNTFVT